MNRIAPGVAFFIKLGEEGKYEAECLTNPGMAKIGWDSVPQSLLQGVNGKIDWEAVRTLHNGIYKSKGMATNQTHQLQNFFESGPDVLWITFSNNLLYWCFLEPHVEFLNDNKKIRRTRDGWHNTDVVGNPLEFRRISGSLLALQGFRGTICSVHERDYLVRKINSENSTQEQRALAAHQELIDSIGAIIQSLNWKEFELLNDLIFREAGWQRVGEVGRIQKGIDLDLYSPITNQSFHVQVKSEADLIDFRKFETLALNNAHPDRFYFVMHQPNSAIKQAAAASKVQVWFADDIARHAVNYGLARWIIDKAK